MVIWLMQGPRLDEDQDICENVKHLLNQPLCTSVIGFLFSLVWHQVLYTITLVVNCCIKVTAIRTLHAIFVFIDADEEDEEEVNAHSTSAASESREATEAFTR
jgi:hypothetical protein